MKKPCWEWTGLARKMVLDRAEDYDFCQNCLSFQLLPALHPRPPTPPLQPLPSLLSRG